MKLYRPTIWGWWVAQIVGAAVYAGFHWFDFSGGVALLVGVVFSSVIFMAIAPVQPRVSLFPPMFKRCEPREAPDPIAQTASFKAKRRREEIKAWEAAYCDALGFREREAWHRASAIEKARKGEPYWSPNQTRRVT